MMRFMRNSLGEVVRHPNWPNPRALIDEPDDCCCEDPGGGSCACCEGDINGVQITLSGTVAGFECDPCDGMNRAYCIPADAGDGCHGKLGLIVDPGCGGWDMVAEYTITGVGTGTCRLYIEFYFEFEAGKIDGYLDFTEGDDCDEALMGNLTILSASDFGEGICSFEFTSINVDGLC